MNTQNKNFLFGVINGALFSVFFAFASETTVIPVFISQLTSNKLIIGYTTAIISIGWFIPQFFSSFFAKDKIYKMPMYRFTSMIRMIAWTTVVIITLFITTSIPKSLALLLIVLTISIYSLSDGIAGVAFMDIVAKTIPRGKRSSFFATRIFFGGILSIGAGITVKVVLADPVNFPFPFNFSFLFLLGFIFSFTALISFWFVKEPVSHVTEQKCSFIDYFKNSVKIFKKDKMYRNLLAAKILSGSCTLALPFYIIYAKDILHFKNETVGTLLLVQLMGSIISNFLWAYLGDKKGAHLVLLAYAVIGFIVPLLALSIPFTGLAFPIYLLIFLLIGSSQSASTVGYNDFLLSISPDKERSTYIGLMNTIISIIILFPILGGLLINMFNYQIMFIITAALTFIGFISTLKLKIL